MMRPFGVVAILLVVGAAVLAASGGDAAPVAAAATRIDRPTWSCGERREYRVQVESQVVLDDREAGPGAIEQRIEARLSLQADDVRDDGVALFARLDDVSLQVAGNLDAVLSRAMERTCRVELGASGAVQRIEFDAGAEPEVAGRIDELLRLFQVVVPDEANGSWTVRERHAAGEYDASYRALDGQTLEKQRVAYVAPSSARVVSSRARIDLGRGPFVDAFDATEELWIATATGRARLIQTASLSAAGVHFEGEVNRMRSDWSREATARTDRVEPTLETREPTVADEREFDALLTILSASAGRDVKALLRLRDLLRTCPGLCARIPDLLREDVVQGDAAATLLHALQLADHDAAHDALSVVIADARQADMDRIRAVVALGGTNRPRSEIVDRLYEAADARAMSSADIERADTARLALGRLAATMRSEAPDRAGRIRDRLVDTLRACSDAPRTSIALKALGNARDPALAGVVGAQLDAASPMVRAAAAASLGRTTSDRAPDLLARRLEIEADGGVRAALAAALLESGDPLDVGIPVVERRAADESDPDARRAYGLYLAARIERHPALRSVLGSLLASERDDRARATMAAALARTR